jgi:hypothetical protein
VTFAFNVVRLNNGLYAGVMAPEFDRREDRLKAGNDAQPHLTTATVHRAAPKASWMQLAGRQLFTSLGTGDEVPYVALDGTNGLELIGAKRASDGVGYAAGTVHARRRGISGVLALASVSWKPRTPMTFGVETFFISSAGATDPIGAGDLTTLPTLSLNQEQLGLSSVLFGAVEWAPKCAGFDIGIEHRIENNVDPTCFNAAQPFPVQAIGPGIAGPSEVSFSFDTEDLDTAVGTPTSITITGLVYNHLGVGLGATGITITLSKPLLREQKIPGADGSAARRQIIATPTYDGTTKPITIATF